MAKIGSGNLKHLFNKKSPDEISDIVEEEILSIVEEGHEQGAILRDEAEMISNVFEFGDKEVKDVMTSRQRIVGIDSKLSLEEAVTIFLDNHYSRYPIYQEDVDNIVGILHFKDAIIHYMKDKDTGILEIVREPYHVHPTQNISKLFKDMQSKKIHMAIVVDEYGQTEGIVAMEDILEVLVGDILDEHDEEEQDIYKMHGTDTYFVKGMARLEMLEEILGIEFPDEDIDTVNGFILYQLGRLPQEEEKIEIVYQGYSFKPLEIQDKMVKMIRVEKAMYNV